MNFDPFKRFDWKLAHDRSIQLGPNSVIMGVLNVTPDSFSDGGRYIQTDQAVKQALHMHEAGAQIIDIGGESSRPGAQEVSAKQEQDRILPVIEALAGHSMILSVDTWRAETAKLAIEAGAHIINDIWGFQRDENLASIVANQNGGCVMMHTGRGRTRLQDVIEDQKKFLSISIEKARKAGIDDDAILLDPGFGFAKDPEDNIELLARLNELFGLGFHILTGTSRKRFIGHLTGRQAEGRDVGTAATSVIARMQGSAVFRVHDVPKNKDVLNIADAVLASQKQGQGVPG